MLSVRSAVDGYRERSTGRFMYRTAELKIEIPQGAAWVLEKLHAAGQEAYVVGGCVRDSLLGRRPDDWDITTSARPEETKALFRRTVDTGIQHGTVTVMVGSEGYEVTTYRIDGEYADGRHPDNVTFTASLLEDLKRRDFTINAMAYSPAEGLVDEFDGIGDIERHVIRAVGDPVQRFTEDALRMMRAIRFSAQLDYRIEEATREGIRLLAPNLRKVSAERIRVELEKLLMSDHPGELREAWELGLLEEFLPELAVCMTCEQRNPHHCHTVGEHILAAVAAAPHDKVLRLTMLLHDIAKPLVKTTDENGTDHFRGHVEKSAQMADRILRDLKYDNQTREKVVRLVAWHDRKLGDSLPKIRRSIAELGEELFLPLLEVKTADVLAQSDYQREEKLEKIAFWRTAYEEIRRADDCLSLKDLAVSGRDLIAEGVRPGKQMGTILHGMLEDVLENPAHNTREYLLAKWAESLPGKG